MKKIRFIKIGEARQLDNTDIRDEDIPIIVHCEKGLFALFILVKDSDIIYGERKRTREEEEQAIKDFAKLKEDNK